MAGLKTTLFLLVVLTAANAQYLNWGFPNQYPAGYPDRDAPYYPPNYPYYPINNYPNPNNPYPYPIQSPITNPVPGSIINGIPGQPTEGDGPNRLINICMGHESGTYIPSPYSCAQFYYCVRDQAITGQCPVGYAFSLQSQSCSASSYSCN